MPSDPPVTRGCLPGLQPKSAAPRNLPRYTPDPPPDEGLSSEAREWLQRQFERIHDLWPVDLERRVEDLERLVTSISGSWEITGRPVVELTNVQEYAPPLIEKVAVTRRSNSFRISPDGYVAAFNLNVSLEIPRPDGSLDALTWMRFTSDGRLFIGTANAHLLTTQGEFEENLTVLTPEQLGVDPSWIIETVWKNGDYTYALARSFGLLEAFGHIRVVRSLDIVTWTLYSDHPYMYVRSEARGAVAADGQGNLLCAAKATNPSQNPEIANDNSRALWSGDNGLSWNYGEQSLGTGSLTRASGAFYANGKWFISNNIGRLRMTGMVGGEFSTVYYTGVSNNIILDVAYGDGVYVAAQKGPGLHFMSSPDGVTWTNRGPCPAAAPTQLWYDPEWKWGCISFNDCYTSEDGLSWTQFTSLTTSRGSLVVYPKL